jgi:exopolysaccharide production protein ExoZ
VGETAIRQAPSGKLESVQILRGTGALLVIGIHINNWLHAREAVIGPSHIAYFANWHQFGAVGVDIFFVISGFVTALTMNRYLGRTGFFLRQRFLRIAPLAYIFSALWVLRLHVIGQPFPIEGVWSTIILAPILPTYHIPTLDVLWTLSFEFTLYLLTCALLLLKRGPVTLIVMLAILGTIGIFVRFDLAPLRFATHPMLYEFALGALAFVLWRDNRLPRWALWASFLAGTAALVLQALLGSGIPANPALAISGDSTLQRVTQYAFPSFLILNFLLIWKPRQNWLARLATLIGNASYSIYLTHLFVISMTIRYLPFPPDGRWIALFVMATVVGIIVYLCLERPLAKLSSGSSMKKTDAPERQATA